MARTGAFEVTVGGPLFEGGRVGEVLDGWAHDVRHDLGESALNWVKTLANQSIKQHETGLYIASQQHDGEGFVSYGGMAKVIYGPWLEGNSSRNKTSRFKGYRIYRKAKRRVRNEVPDVAAELMAKHIGKLQGA
jgi:hypothetical protein